ncbi:hypothetical protein LTR97_012209 [Elasticomyces elasticus]|uniref:Uncharacterized protein n=1 Tax=Elasticomyces elasticus TaxID=574655 RepID=A0AAN7ZQM9_9PEZI|nr:hypothetical protein LTR97_012209 [Elasticomyces elasticus]
MIALTLPSKDLNKWIEDAFQGMKRVNSRLMPDENNIKLMVLCGGFFCNATLVDLFKTYYDRAPYNIKVSACSIDPYGNGDLSVARGLGAFEHTLKAKAPAKFGYGIAQAELLNGTGYARHAGQNKRHADITADDINDENSERVFRKEDGRLWVDGRYTTLLPVSSSAEMVSVVEEEFQEHTFYPDLGKPIIRAYFNESKIEEGSPVFSDDQLTILNDGIEPWGKPREFEVPNIRDYPPCYPKNGSRSTSDISYDVYTRVRLEKKGLNETITLDLNKPSYNPYWKKS